MNIQENGQDKERMGLIAGAAQDTARALGIDLDNYTHESVVSKIDSTIVDLVFDRETPVSSDKDCDLGLAALWGTQLVKGQDWYWADVVVNNEFNEVAVISPDKSMIIFPFAFVRGCIGRQCVCTISLCFNMLTDGSAFAQLPSGGYENILLHIRHVIPPYTLEPSA